MGSCVSIYRGKSYQPLDPFSNETNSRSSYKLLFSGENPKNINTFALKVPAIEKHTKSVNQVIEELLSTDPEIERFSGKDMPSVYEDAICCYGDMESASVFNSNKTSYNGSILEIAAEKSKLIIDGRNYLYEIASAFGKFGNSSPQMGKISLCFGRKMREYLIKTSAIANLPHNLKMRYIDYICMDQDIIDRHLENGKILLKRGKVSDAGYFSALGIIGGYESQDIRTIHSLPNLNKDYRRSRLQEGVIPLYLPELLNQNMKKSSIRTNKIGFEKYFRAEAIKRAAKSNPGSWKRSHEKYTFCR